MPRDLTHAVLEGLDEAKSTGGLVIMKKKKKEGGEEEKGGFKLPAGPSKLGLDRCESLGILGVCKDLVSTQVGSCQGEGEEEPGVEGCAGGEREENAGGRDRRICQKSKSIYSR